MFNSEVRNLLIQVICSWQVWLVTVVLVLYIFLVNYVARVYRRRRNNSDKQTLVIPKAKPQTPAPAPAESGVITDSDELELDEEAPPPQK